MKNRRPTLPRSGGRRARVLRGLVICAMFAAAFGGCAWLTTRSILADRERQQIAIDLRKVEQKRQGRVVHTQKNGHCRMQSFDNGSGKIRFDAEANLPCDAPMKDPVALAKDFNWGNK